MNNLFHTWATLNKRTMFPLFNSVGPSLHPYLIHCFVDHRFYAADPLGLLLTQNDSALFAILPGAL